MAFKHSTVGGHRYLVLKEGVTKAVADRSVAWQRRGGFVARAKKVARGNWMVLTR